MGSRPGLSANGKEDKHASNDNKQLLNQVFVISRIIEVDVGVITLAEASIILDITKTKSNNCFIIH